MYQSEWKRFLIVVMGLLEILIFSGTILGWTSLKFMLQREGIFDYLCPNENSTNLTTTSTTTPNTTDSTIYVSEFGSQTNSSESSNAKLNQINNTRNATLFDSIVKKNFTVKINFTFIDEKSANPFNKFVIPFETEGSFNHSFIHKLLNDSSLLIKSNSSDVQLNLKTKLESPSIFKEFLDLYSRESSQPMFTEEVSVEMKTCKDQDDILNYAFGASSFCMGAAAFIWGFLLQKLGLRYVRLIINGMFALGVFLLCFVAKGRDWLLFPSLLIMSLSGVPIRIANMQISNLYPSKRSTIISIYSGAFSASSIVYVTLNFFYTKVGLSFFWVNFILVLLSMGTIPFSLWVLPKDKVKEPETEEKKRKNNQKDQQQIVVDENQNVYSIQNAQELFQKKQSLSLIKGKTSSIRLQNYKPIVSPNLGRKNGFINEAFVSDSENGNAIDQSNTNDKTTVTSIKHQSPPLRISLLTLAFNLHQLWFSWMITYMMMYVGSLNLWAERVTLDTDKQSRYSNIYGLTQVLALVISPIAGLLMDWQLAKTKNETDTLVKRVKQAQAGFLSLSITTLTLLACILCHFFNQEEYIYASIVFVTIFRSFLLAVGSAFLRIRFHPEHFNQLLGIMSSVSAVVSLLQLPLIRWEKSSNFQAQVFNTFVSFLAMSNTIYLLITPLQRYLIAKEENQLEKYI